MSKLLYLKLCYEFDYLNYHEIENADLNWAEEEFEPIKDFLK